MLVPAVISPIDWPGALQFTAVAFLRNAGPTEFLPVPFNLQPNTSVFSLPICVQGYRQFQGNCRVTSLNAGQAEWHINVLDPYNHARVVNRFTPGEFLEQDNFNGHPVAITWGYLPAAGIDGGDQVVPEVIKLELRNNHFADAATVSRLDGLWCAT